MRSRFTAITRLQQLLALHDRAFVFGAYGKILGREPDTTGLANYLEQIRAGKSKIGILAQLGHCAERHAIQTNVLEWSAAVRQRDTPPSPALLGPRQSPRPGNPMAACAAPQFAELLAYPEKDFISVVFRILTSAEPPPGNLAAYSRKLRQGMSRRQLVAEVLSSEDARSASEFTVSLASAIQLYRLARLPLVGWIIGLATGIEGEGACVQRLRRIENQVFQLGNDQPASSDDIGQDSLVTYASANDEGQASEGSGEGDQQNAITAIARPAGRRSAAAMLRSLPPRIDGIVKDDNAY